MSKAVTKRRAGAACRAAALVVTAAASLFTVTAAEAQTYYSRERLVGLPRTSSATTPTPPATPAPIPAAWSVGPWGSWSSGCSDTSTRTRFVSCVGSGELLPDAQCSGQKPTSSQTLGQNAGCLYAPGNWITTGWVGTCSATAFKTESGQCERSDGRTVADEECTSRGIALTRSSVEPNFTACSYAWQSGAWSAWSSDCSAAATRSRTVLCRRADGTVAADASCTEVRPGSSEGAERYDGCGYAATGWGNASWNSTCSATATKTETASCLRGDGMPVAASECTSRGIAVSRRATEENFTGCTYTPSYGTYGTCTNGSQNAVMNGCSRSDGTAVPLSSCSGHPQQTTRVCQASAQCGTFYLNRTVLGSSYSQRKTMSTTSIAPLLDEGGTWCSSVKADACQVNVRTGSATAYFGSGIGIYDSASVNYTAACTR